MRDFEVNYRAGERLRAGESLYRTSDGHYMFKYFPSSALLYVPFSLLPLPVAKVLWYGLTVVCSSRALRRLEAPGLGPSASALVPPRDSAGGTGEVLRRRDQARADQRPRDAGAALHGIGAKRGGSGRPLGPGDGDEAVRADLPTLLHGPRPVRGPRHRAQRSRGRVSRALCSSTGSRGTSRSTANGTEPCRSRRRASSEALTTFRSPRFSRSGLSHPSSRPGSSSVSESWCSLLLRWGKDLPGAAVLEVGTLLTLIPLVSPLGWDYQFLTSALALTVLARHWTDFPRPFRLASGREPLPHRILHLRLDGAGGLPTIHGMVCAHGLLPPGRCFLGIRTIPTAELN